MEYFEVLSRLVLSTYGNRSVQGVGRKRAWSNEASSKPFQSQFLCRKINSIFFSMSRKHVGSWFLRVATVKNTLM